MKRLFIISNQLPVNIRKVDEKFQIEPGDERERTGLNDFYNSFDCQWIGLRGADPSTVYQSFDISTTPPTLGSAHGSVDDAGVIDAGNGWY